MSRLKKVQQIEKKIIKKKQEQKTVVRRLRKLGIGREKVIIIEVEKVKGKDYLIRIVLESIEDGRKGTFLMHLEGYAVDSLLESIYGEVEEEFCLEDLVGNKVIATIVRNGRFLNVDYFESLDNYDEYESQEISDGDLELELEEGELDIEEIEIDEEDLEGYL